MIKTWLLTPLRLLFWSFFKPLTLAAVHRELGVEVGRNGDFALLSVRPQLSTNPALRRHVGQMTLTLLWGLLIIVCLAGGVRLLLPGAAFYGLTVILGAFLGFLAGMAGGLTFGVIAGVTGGLTLAGTFALAFGVALNTGFGLTGAAAFGTAAGAAVGIVGGIIFGLPYGVPVGIGGGILSGVVFGTTILLLSLSQGERGAWIVGPVVAGLDILVLLLLYFRLPLFMLYAPWNALLFAMMSSRAGAALSLYRLCPQNWDELIWLRLPFLERQLVLLAQADRKNGLEAIARVTTSFRQGWAAQRVLESLSAAEMLRFTLDDLASLKERLAWLPAYGPQSPPSVRAETPLPFWSDTIDKLSQETAAALSASSNFNRLRRLNRAQDLARKLQLAATDLPAHVASQFKPVFAHWAVLLEEEISHISITQSLAREIPNPYIPGQPILADSEQVFMGRRDLFAEIERSLTVVHQPPTLLLYGPRRSGKTSLLNQLPRQLPGDVVPVFVNLQEVAATAYSTAGFVTALAHAIEQQSLRHRQLILPPVEAVDFSDEPYLAFGQWLEAAEATFRGYTVFVAFDEFEWVEKAIDQGRLGEEVLSFFRNLIQRGGIRLALLFAGVHTLDELNNNWPSYFINVKTVKITYLPEADARRLITNPIADFPLDYETTALTIFLQQTRCQPYLIQLVAFELVNYLNSAERRARGEWLTVGVDDLEESFTRGLEAGYNYFAESWNSCSPQEQLVLADLAAGRQLAPELDQGERLLAVSRLIRRDLLEQAGSAYRFQIPLVERWIREEKPPELVRAEAPAH